MKKNQYCGGSSLAAEVNDDGWVDRRGDDVDYDYDGVRPALYLKF